MKHHLISHTNKTCFNDDLVPIVFLIWKKTNSPTHNHINKSLSLCVKTMSEYTKLWALAWTDLNFKERENKITTQPRGRYRKWRYVSTRKTTQPTAGAVAFLGTSLQIYRQGTYIRYRLNTLWLSSLFKKVSPRHKFIAVRLDKKQTVRTEAKLMLAVQLASSTYWCLMLWFSIYFSEHCPHMDAILGYPQVFKS